MKYEIDIIEEEVSFSRQFFTTNRQTVSFGLMMELAFVTCTHEKENAVNYSGVSKVNEVPTKCYVSLFNTAKKLIGKTISDDSGNFTFYRITPDVYILQLDQFGTKIYASKIFEVDLTNM
jgi:hypothetical protein